MNNEQIEPFELLSSSETDDANFNIPNVDEHPPQASYKTKNDTFKCLKGEEIIINKQTYPVPSPTDDTIYCPNLVIKEYYQKAQIDINKKRVITQQKANLTAKRELQQTNITIYSSGKVSINRELFNDSFGKVLAIKIVEMILYVPLDSEHERGILKLIMTYDDNQQIHTLWIEQDSLDEKKLQAIFLRAGISFGFGKKKNQKYAKHSLLR